ncbi:palmitoyltransferase ZDHHC6 isoform X2 [Aplysia californica]|uniref:Palmitoyltransferase n=1 Tax=Aplysia californica TaxID=6500 RepID=A0ABM0JY67_APLCA|nr:palmitoyltransferase ZDHHC6 isoform X2 [Aplysia californica]
MGYEVVGTWRQFFHWGPLLALGVIFTISWVTIRCDLMWWPPHLSIGGFINFLLFVTWVALTLYNYFAACMKGPGFIPLEWKPRNPDHMRYLQFCECCQGYKAPRSHHCRKCGRCVMKMDHHCPWINTCCGHFNHGNFCWFLLFAPIGCIHAIVILAPSIYRALNFHHYYYYKRDEPLVYLGVWGFVVTMFGVGLAIGVIIAVGMLFYIQIKSVLKNETGIEGWIIEKALDRIRDDEEGEFVYPYDLGWKENFKQVFRWSGRPKSNGFTWDVVQDCHQYTLTVEQLIQKQDKRDRTIEFVITENYSGALCPVSKGLRIGCCVPCTDEPRIKVEEGDKVLVTRWKKRWLYGTKVLSGPVVGADAGKRIRGWFPRRCAVEIIDDNMNDKKDS